MGTKRAAGPPVSDLLPPVPDLRRVAEAAAGCKACDLWEKGTQTVFGEGPPDAEVVMVGEQPGDVEDQRGRPFVGPAGRVLDQALEAARIDRARVYVTNAVKHFKWEAKGKRRIHSKPDNAEVQACLPWLIREVELIRPLAVVALGATAAQALLGRNFRVTKQRGEFLQSPQGWVVMATVHPSSILRAPDDAARRLAMDQFIEDLSGLAPQLEMLRKQRAA